MSYFSLDANQLILCRIVSGIPISERWNAACALISQMSEGAAFEFARKNQVAEIVGDVLAQKAGDLAFSGAWQDAHNHTKDLLIAYLAELDLIAGRLAEKNIFLVALKNGGIARGIYPCPGCCPMGDLDTLVEKKYFRQAHQILLDAGFKFEFRSHFEKAEVDAAEASGGAEYWKTLPNGEKLWFELQWRPVAGRWIRPDQEPATEELMAHSISIPGTAARLLSPEDNLLQVCLHTAKHTYVRAPGFRLHLDVERIVRGQKVDWDIFLGRVKSLQVKSAVYFSLAIPKEVFDTPIPDYVLKALRPAAWKERLIAGWLRRAGLFNPDEQKFSQLGYIFFVSLLYDDFAGLLRSIFPSRAWIRQRYGDIPSWLLPLAYARRLFDLVLRHENT